jgi:hypothetical protein
MGNTFKKLIYYTSKFFNLSKTDNCNDNKDDDNKSVTVTVVGDLLKDSKDNKDDDNKSVTVTVVEDLLKDSNDNKGDDDKDGDNKSVTVVEQKILIEEIKLECIICFDENAKEFTYTPCMHPFHTSCLIEWRKKSNECPLCRTKLENVDIRNLLNDVKVIHQNDVEDIYSAIKNPLYRNHTRLSEEFNLPSYTNYTIPQNNRDKRLYISRGQENLGFHTRLGVTHDIQRKESKLYEELIEKTDKLNRALEEIKQQQKQ